MNEASKIISESVLGKYSRNIEIGKRWYQVKAPSIPVIASIVYHWSDIDLKEEHTALSVISEVTKNYKPIVKGLARALAGNGTFKRVRYWYYLIVLRNITSEQLLEAVQSVLELIDGKSFFASASLAKNATNLVAKPK